MTKAHNNSKLLIKLKMKKPIQNFNSYYKSI